MYTTPYTVQPTKQVLANYRYIIMVFYLLLPYIIQSFRAYHHLNKTDNYSRLDAMLQFDGVMMVLLESSLIAEHFGGYQTMENIWDLTS